MKQSISYYITLFVLKLKGVKKDFSQAPIDFKKIRKEDVHEPKGSFYKQHLLRKFTVADTIVTEIGIDKNADTLLIFIHGGAFISGPVQLHWDVAKQIAKQTQTKIWMCDYPKAPENKISKISKNIDAIYKLALEQFEPNKISIIGDSVGGTLTASLTQRLAAQGKDLPNKIILISPVMDATLSNPRIEAVDKKDLILSKTGVLSAKKMCADNNDLKNEMISPLYGSFANFPRTFLFLAENDITFPDQQLAAQKMIDAGIDLNLIEGKNMPHIWPILPIMKEAKMALNQIIEIVKE